MPVLPPTPESIAAAAATLRAGGMVALPTETVYGLAADATDGAAVAAVYAAKGRPRFNPLIVHVAEPVAVAAYAVPTPPAEALIARFWPGPLTLVLPARPDSPIASLVTAGLDTIAVRLPDHAVTRAVIAATGRPLAAPSANRSGGVSPTTAAHVVADLGADVLVLDGGPCAAGIESTILDLTHDPPQLIRAGAVTVAAIAAVLGPGAAPVFPAPATSHPTRPIAPGQLASHYAPRARVRRNATSVETGEALLAFGPIVPPTAGPVCNLSPTGDLAEAARGLFAALRALDATGAATIAVMPIPTDGLGAAIDDRLARAAAPRP
jgi:L-threonylcarbamoyladenylate synthase